MTAGVAVGQENDATVTQDGTQNAVDVEQQAAGPAGQNTFSARQDGEANVVGTFEQAGSGNDASIRQVGDENTVASNPQQGFLGENAPNSFNGLIDVDQYGTANDVYDVDQRGYNNTAIIQQRGLASEVNNNLVDIDAQISESSGGDEPAPSAPTPAADAMSTMQTAYTGTGNTAIILQATDGNAVGTGTGAVRGVRQKGTQNLLAVLQVGGSGNAVGTTLSGAYNGSNTVAQDGDRNTATVSQRGLGHHTVEYLIQKGKTNQLAIDQFGGRSNTAATIQLNGQNSAGITQNGSHNMSHVTQK